MKILLVNPPDDLFEVIGGGEVFISNMEPLGILYIAGVLREGGHEVAVIDAYAERLSQDDLEARIEAFGPAMVGFTCFTSNGGIVYTFTRRLKAKHPEITIVLGNVHASVFARQYLLNGCCDYVIHGEGEFPMLQLADCLEKGQSVSGVPALSYLQSGEPVTTSGPYYIKDISVVPMPARDLVKQDLYNIKQINNFSLHNADDNKTRKHMFTSRGCPNRCTFCTVHHSIRQRFNTVERSLDEVESLINDYNAGYIFFTDSLFVGKKSRVLEICRGIKDRKLNFKWGCEAHVKFIDEEMLRAMEDAGCVDLDFGLESGVDRLLKEIGKHFTSAEAMDVIKLVKRTTSIHATGLFILGLPGETPAETRQTIRHATKLPLDMAQFTILTPFPGSQIFDELNAKGEIDTGIRPGDKLDTDVWHRYSSYISYTDKQPIWVTPGHTAEGLKRLQKQALRSFYFRPYAFWQQLKRIRPSNLPRMVKAAWDTFF